MKKCSRCDQFYNKELFSKKSSSSDGYKSHCKNCEQLDRIKNFERDKELKRQWVLKNKKRHRQCNKEYYLQNKDRLDLWRRDYRRKYEANKLANDLQHKLRNRLRARLHSSFIKKESVLDFIGCSLAELRAYLESRFLPGMTWDNWGRSGWHIDHVKPLSSFDLTDSEQVKLACHYTNLQPLWAKDNLSKSSKV